MSIQLKNTISCNHVSSESVSANTSRLGSSVELRFYNGKLYIYNVSGDVIGLVGADVAFDALPTSYHVAQMGSNGSLTATVIESELSLAGISVSDFTQAVQDEFTAGILSTLSFDAIIEVLSVGEGSAVVLYQVIPVTGTSAADLATATTTLSDTAAITTALSTSSVLSTATPTVTVAPATMTASVPSKIISLALTLPESGDPSATVNATGAFNSIQLLINDGTERELANATTSTTSSVFTPAQAFYQLKAKMLGPTSVLNEWVVEVPSVTKAIVTPGVVAPLPTEWCKWKKGNENWNARTHTNEGYNKGILQNGWGHDELGNVYCISYGGERWNANINNKLYRFDPNEPNGLKKICEFPKGVSMHQTYDNSNEGFFCNSLHIKNGTLHMYAGAKNSRILRIDNIHSYDGGEVPLSDMTTLMYSDLNHESSTNNSCGIMCVSNNYIYFTCSGRFRPMDASFSAGVANGNPSYYEKVFRIDKDTGHNLTCVMDVSSGSNNIKGGISIQGLRSDGENVYVLATQYRTGGMKLFDMYTNMPGGDQGQVTGHNIYKFAETEIINANGTQSEVVYPPWNNNEGPNAFGIANKGYNTLRLDHPKLLCRLSYRFFPGSSVIWSDPIYNFQAKNFHYHDGHLYMCDSWYNIHSTNGHNRDLTQPPGYNHAGALSDYANNPHWQANGFNVIKVDCATGQESVLKHLEQITAQGISGPAITWADLQANPPVASSPIWVTSAQQGWEDGMNWTISGGYIYFPTGIIDSADKSDGHGTYTADVDYTPGSNPSHYNSYQLAGRVTRMPIGAPTTVSATEVGEGTLQYSTDGTNYATYTTDGFLPPSDSYSVYLRKALDYQITTTLANDPNNPVTNNDHPTLYHQNPTVSDRPGIAIYVGTQHVGFGGSTDTFTLFHRDATLEADLVPGLQFTLSGVTGPNADFWNGTYTVKSNDGAYQGNYRFSFDHPNISGYTWLGGVTAGPDGSGTATVRNPGVVVSFSTSGTVTHYSTPIVKSIG